VKSSTLLSGTPELSYLRDRAHAWLEEAEQVVDQSWADTEDRFERAWHNLSGAARIVRDRLGG
jgi:hypothetical protein